MATRGARTKALVLPLALGAVLAGLGACGDGSGAGSSSSTGTSAPITSAAATPADDLDRWLARLDGVHPEPFHAVDRATFVAALDDLAAAMPTMSPAESAVGVMRVAGLLSRESDGHQFALVQPDDAWPMLPLQVY